MPDVPAPPASPPVSDQEPPTKEALVAAVRAKLKESFLRRLEGRHAIEKERDVIAYRVYSWSHELLLALAAAGFSHPLLSMVLPPTPASGATPEPQANYSALATLAGYPTLVTLVLVTVLAAWLFLRAWVAWKKLQDRGPQILACARELGSLESDLTGTLGTDGNPLPELAKLIARSKEVIDRYFKAELWPWPVGPESDEVDKRIAARADKLCTDYQGNWK